MSSTGLVTVSINGREVQAEKGRLLIDVAEELGVFVPRFCYHPGMKSVAVCRMCLVQIEGQRKLMPACATPVDEGMKVNTVDPEAVDAQQGMLEFLLINHPLDCPICDRAGECPLQDQTYGHGPGSSRYVEPKRTFEKALEISDLVVLDRERCVLCWRCVRFSDEIAGDSFIELVDRGSGTQILTFNDEPFDSYFSGNTVQICPVGALTGKPYRFVSRPWDLQSAPSVCSYCSVGCPITNESRGDKMVRCQALPNEQVNDFWICDKGRFGFHHISSEDRLQTPLVREGDGFRSASWSEAYEAAAAKLKDKKVGVIAGGHVTTEDAYAISHLARKVLGTADIDSRIQDAGAPYEEFARATGVAGSTASISDLDDAATIVWVGPDPKETLPVLYLRLRLAVLSNKADLIVVSPRQSSLDRIASKVVRCPAGGEAEALGTLTDLQGPVVIGWGPAWPGRDETDTVQGLLHLASSNDASILVCPPHAGSQGLIDMGVHPALDPGHVLLDEPGRDTRAILEAAASGELDALVLIGADPISDFPDAELARAAMKSKAAKIVIELFPTETVAHADVVFPSAAAAEREGTFTNLERRLQKLEPLLAPPGSAREPWRLIAGLAGALGSDPGWSDVASLWSDLKKNVPTHASVDLEALRPEPPTPGANYETGFAPREEIFSNSGQATNVVAGPGGQYPKGYRSGAPFQTGNSWPLSWELRAFEAKQRPGFIPAIENAVSSNGATSPSAEGTASSDGSGGFALLAGRLIYDEGTMVSKSAALRNLQKKPFVELNADDAQALGLTDGDEAVVRRDGYEARLPVAIGDVARGAVFVPYDQVGLRANELLSGGVSRVEVTKA